MNFNGLKNKSDVWNLLEQCAARQMSTDRASVDGCILPVEAGGLHANFSRHSIDKSTFQALLSLADVCHLPSMISDYFTGAKINSTENRAVLHTALRRPLDQPLVVDGVDIMQGISDLHDKMADLSHRFDRGELAGVDGNKITDVIHIGIGGSDLGPSMVYDALSSCYRSSVRVHFLANVDNAYMLQRLEKINPRSVLVVVVSKSFTTAETLANARLVKQWMLSSGLTNDECARQFYAVTSAPNNAIDFGVDPDRVLPMWDWVGGRFSVWSGVSLVLVLAFGMPCFKDFLAGAHAMDQHFRYAPFSQNMPVIMGLLGVWYGNFLQASSQAVIPYSEYLRAFPDYLQQLHMESLGKQVDRQGRPLTVSTGRVLWGGVGTHSQHSFHQLLMQGTQRVPVDFILPVHDSEGQLNEDLVAHCLAQAEVLWQGSARESSLDANAEHKRIAGKRPSTMILMKSLTPYNLGALVAMYEHKVLVQSVIWNINAYDQWGVEQGKRIAKNTLQALRQDEPDVFESDSVMSRLISLIKEEMI